MIIITILYNTPPSEQITHRPQRAQTTYILSQLCNYPPPPLYTLSLPHTTSHLSHSISPCTTPKPKSSPRYYSTFQRKSNEEQKRKKEKRKKNNPSFIFPERTRNKPSHRSRFRRWLLALINRRERSADKEGRMLGNDRKKAKISRVRRSSSGLVNLTENEQTETKNEEEGRGWSACFWSSELKKGSKAPPSLPLFLLSNFFFSPAYLRRDVDWTLTNDPDGRHR